MAPRRSHSKVSKLPRALVDRLNEAIAKHGYTYDELSKMVDDWIAKGLLAREDAPSRSALGRYGKNFLARMEQLGIMREQAKTIVTEAAGDGLVMEEAAVNLVLNEIMTIFMHSDPEQGMKPADVARIASGLGKLQQSSVRREALKMDFEKRAQAAAKKVTAIGKRAGLSKDTIATIEREVLGIAR